MGGIGELFDVRLRDLTWAGWLLAVVSIGLGVLVAVPVGRWALEDIGNAFLRQHRAWLVPILSLPGLAGSVLAFVAGRRVLAFFGFRAHERGSHTTKRRRPSARTASTISHRARGERSRR